MKLIKKHEVLVKKAQSNTTLYEEIKKGLMTPSVHLGANSVAWPEYEVNAIVAARTAGKPESEIRSLVTKLVELRTDYIGKSEQQILLAVENLLVGGW